MQPMKGPPHIWFPPLPGGARRLLGLFSLIMLTSALSCSTPKTTAALSWSQLPPLPDPLGVAGPFAGVSGGALIVAGGANFPDRMPWQGGKKVWHDEAFVLTSLNGTWKPAGKLPRPLGYGVSASVNDGLFCVGGSDMEKHFAEVFELRYTNHTLKIVPMASLPIPLANAAGAVLDGTLYIVGGSESPGEQSASRRMFALDCRRPDSRWLECEPLPGKARILPVAAAVNGALYVMGGAALEAMDGKVKRVYLREAWRYRPGTGWQQLADLPKPAVAAPTPAPCANHTIYIVGGDDGKLAGFQPLEQHPGFPKSILAYDIATDSWHEAGNVPEARATAPVTFWQNRFVIPSGEKRPGVRSPEVWTLHLETHD